MSLNPHQTMAQLGDLVVVVTANGKHTDETGMRLWFECEVATVVGIDKARCIKAVLFARHWSVERCANLSSLVALVPYPAAQIDVPLTMAAAREHGKPFASLEEVRAAVRPFVLVDLIERGYNPAVGEPPAPERDETWEAIQAIPGDVLDPDEEALNRILAEGVGDGPVFASVLDSADGGPDVADYVEAAGCPALVDQLLEWKNAAVAKAVREIEQAERDADGKATAWSATDQFEHDQDCEARIDADVANGGESL